MKSGTILSTSIPAAAAFDGQLGLLKLKKENHRLTS